MKYQNGPDELRIIEAPWRLYAKHLRAIRRVVFVEEQRVPLAEEWDGRDENARHFLAFEGECAVATARLLADGQIGRMAVLRSHRNRGIGAALLCEVIAAAKAAGMARVFLHAQVNAIRFYERANFVAFGDEYWEAGILHRSMQLTLDGGSP